MGRGGGWPLGGPRTLVRSVIEKQVLLKLQSRLCGFQHQTGGCGVAGEGVRAFSAGAASGNSRARLRLRLRPSQPSSYSAHRQLLDSSPVWSKCKQTQITQSIVIVLLLLVVVVDVEGVLTLGQGSSSTILRLGTKHEVCGCFFGVPAWTLNLRARCTESKCSVKLQERTFRSEVGKTNISGIQLPHVSGGGSQRSRRTRSHLSLKVHSWNTQHFVVFFFSLCQKTRQQKQILMLKKR